MSGIFLYFNLRKNNFFRRLIFLIDTKKKH